MNTDEPVRSGMTWHPFNHRERDLCWIRDAEGGAAWVYFPHLDELWFYYRLPGRERGSVKVELITSIEARRSMRALLDEESLKPR